MPTDGDEEEIYAQYETELKELRERNLDENSNQPGQHDFLSDDDNLKELKELQERANHDGHIDQTYEDSYLTTTTRRS